MVMLTRRSQSVAGMFRIQAWIMDHRAEIENTSMTMIEAAKKLTEQFGSKVSPASISCVSNACGFRWPTATGPRNSDLRVSPDAFRALVGAVANLYNELGVALPGEFDVLRRQVGFTE